MISSDQDNFQLNNLGLRVADHISAMLVYWDRNLIPPLRQAAKRLQAF